MTGKPPTPPGALTLLAGLSLLLLTACASTTPNAASGPGQGSSGSAEPATSAKPSAAPASSPAAPPSPASPPASGTHPVGCPLKTITLTAKPGERPAPVCLHPGDTLTINTQPSPLQPWQAATSTDPTALGCTSQRQADGALTITCHALRPGNASVSTTTAAFSGDPHGPAQFTWTLNVQILPDV